MSQKTIIVLPEKYKNHYIPIEDILFVEGKSNYSIVHLSNKQPMYLSKTLLWYADFLPTFLRLHKHYLLNPNHITDYQVIHKKHMLRLSNQTQLPIARRRVCLFEPYLDRLEIDFMLFVGKNSLVRFKRGG